MELPDVAPSHMLLGMRYVLGTCFNPTLAAFQQRPTSTLHLTQSTSICSTTNPTNQGWW